jgi:uncharacterized membrane protein
MWKSKLPIIINYLRKKNDWVYPYQIVNDLKLSSATVYKWLGVLEGKGKIEVKQIGSLKLIKIKGG